MNLRVRGEGGREGEIWGDYAAVQAPLAFRALLLLSYGNHIRKMGCQGNERHFFLRVENEALMLKAIWVTAVAGSG